MEYRGVSPGEKEDNYDDVLYSERTLSFLRSKLDDFAIAIFLKIVKENKDHRGFVKTRLEDYRSKRFYIDHAILILDAQGFIASNKDGTMNPYFLTDRGKQLLNLVINERNEQKKQALKRSDQ